VLIYRHEVSCPFFSFEALATVDIAPAVVAFVSCFNFAFDDFGDSSATLGRELTANFVRTLNNF